ncbi:hypothetical protein GCM10027021_10690 [Dyella kyungheensis]
MVSYLLYFRDINADTPAPEKRCLAYDILEGVVLSAAQTATIVAPASFMLPAEQAVTYIARVVMAMSPAKQAMELD